MEGLSRTDDLPANHEYGRQAADIGRVGWREDRPVSVWRGGKRRNKTHPDLQRRKRHTDLPIRSNA